MNEDRYVKQWSNDNNLTYYVQIFIISQIPDLNTDEVSFLAYYELDDSEIESGKSFEPTQLNFGTGTNTRYNTPNSTTYDNGYRLKIEDDLMGSTITLRAGNYDHKWITAHLSDYSSEGGGTFTGEGSDLSTYSYTNTRSSLSG